MSSTHFRAVVAWIVLSVLAPGVALACSCADPEPFPCSEIGKWGGPIFVGTVASVENPPSEEPRVGDGGIARYRFRVDEKLVGSLGDEIDVYSGRGGADCSYHFRTGEQYLVFPYADEDGRLFAGVCSNTSHIATAQAMLNQLRALRDRRPVASIYGVLRRTQQPYAATYDEAYDRPIANTILQLRPLGDRPRFEARTDANGFFAFYQVPAGTYKFWADLPVQLELAQQILSDPLPPLTLPDGACFEKDLFAMPTGRIRGRVLTADGEPVSGSVELFHVDKYDDGMGWWEYQDEKGFFEFERVAPGKYVLVFNNNGRMDSDTPYPRTFYPGVSEKEKALLIELQEGQQVLDADIHVIQGRAIREIIVRVQWPGGGEVPDDVYVHASAAESDSPFAHEVKPGVWRFNLLRGVQYTFSASQDCGLRQEGDTYIPIGERITESVVAHGSDDAVTEITLTLTDISCKPYEPPKPPSWLKKP